jgi:class 3 adenylate cyclase/alpha-beta hydrolase superfamily lysophospholipase
VAPKTQYAKKGDISIAYQVVGDGPIDLVLVNGLVAHLDLLWAEPAATAMLKRLASFSRLLVFDKPGTGLSDPVVGAPTVEQRMRDIEAVMDAANSDRAALFGYSEGGPPSAMFAATYPERTEALILLSTTAKWYPADDFFGDLATFHDAWRQIMDLAYERWGEGEFARWLAPSWERSELHSRTLGIYERASASPGMVRAIVDAVREYDVRAILPTISVPTLVLHATGEQVPVELGRDLAERIPSARFVELPGEDHIVFAGDWELAVSEIEKLLTGEQRGPEPDRVLKTVLFTDIVGSTERAAELGDARWRELLEQHDRIVREQAERIGGRAIKSLGDGFLASFDGPTRAIRCARSIAERLDELGLRVKAGIHTGECETIGDDLGGLAVHIGARIAALAEPSEVLVSGAVCDLVVGSGVEFADRGAHELKGVPGSWRLYSVTADRRFDSRPVESADHAAAALTPGPEDTMRPIDRAAVALAKRAPSMSRLGFRLARPWRRATEG